MRANPPLRPYAAAHFSPPTSEPLTPEPPISEPLIPEPMIAEPNHLEESPGQPPTSPPAPPAAATGGPAPLDAPPPDAAPIAARTQGLQSLGSLSPAPTDTPSSVSSPLSPVPALSDTDRTLLFAYFEHHENLAALATHLAANPLPTPETPSTDPTTSAAATSPRLPSPVSRIPTPDYFSLLTWLNQPHIQDALDAHDRAVARADRRAALDGIRQSLESADNPTNLRRAATTLLRSTILRAAPAVNPDRKGGRPARNPSNGAHVSSASQPTHSPPSPSPLHHPLSPLPPLPPPTSRPTPTADPKTAFAHIAAALTAPQLPVALSTLHAHATPTATFAGYPIPSDPATWPDSLPATLPKGFSLPLAIDDPKETERTDSPEGARSHWTFWATTPTRKLFQCSLTLTRPAPDPAPNPSPNPKSEIQNPKCSSWRLASFDILRDGG